MSATEWYFQKTEEEWRAYLQETYDARAKDSRCVGCGKKHNGEMHRVNIPGPEQVAHYMCLDCYERMDYRRRNRAGTTKATQTAHEVFEPQSVPEHRTRKFNI